jgi:hypothetical protein
MPGSDQGNAILEIVRGAGIDPLTSDGLACLRIALSLAEELVFRSPTLSAEEAERVVQESHALLADWLVDAAIEGDSAAADALLDELFGGDEYADDDMQAGTLPAQESIEENDDDTHHASRDTTRSSGEHSPSSGGTNGNGEAPDKSTDRG